MVQVHIVTHLSLAFMRCVFYRLDIDTRWLLESFSYWRWCGLSPLFCPQIMSVCLLFSASLLCSSPLALSACLCCLGRFLLHCHSDDVKDHGRENKGHWFLASWWAVVLWLKQLLKFTVGKKKSGKQMHQPSAKEKRSAWHFLCWVSLPAQGCSSVSLLKQNQKKALQLRRRLKGFRVKALTSICRLRTVDEKVILLSLTWSYVTLVFSLKSVYRPLNRGRYTDSVTSE